MSTPPPSPRAAAGHDIAWGIIGLIVICVVIEAGLLLGDYNLISYPRLRQTTYEYAGFWPGLLGAWTPNYTAQPYTMFLSYAFLHSGPVHLLVNMITLYSLGRIVQLRVGTTGFFLLYGAAVLGGGLGFGLLAETTRPMVGASGGLFGLAGGVLAWNYVDRFSAAQRLWPVARAAAGLLALNLVMWWLMDGLLAWQTHLGGFLAGWIAALLVDPRSRADESPPPPS
ncbi:rhomboid family intramembrane serine protease [Roseobacter sp. YSTF-M11]|uniref:Rhomboid family intramembrane serine protease n=1 Tax=Roseobacter insulae TaxID=2859783 RepID=A0A9X1G153_9RHOB|nr:rhomboid family intramembrane serine protease [Roseobacter insulae]MBW4710770.1 rhomboid family intramembrane serine protease [Roseobacter insulae]